MKILDLAATLLAAVIGLLIVSGGVKYSSPSMKLELSQVDAFAWALLLLLVLRHRLIGARGGWLPPRLERVGEAALEAFERRPVTAVISAAAVYVVLQTWNSVWRFDSLHASAFDLGFVDQALWSTAHGEFLRSTLAKGQTYLGEHFAPILGLIGQAYRVTDSPATTDLLFFIQACVLASGAPLVYALARRMGVSKRLSVLASLCLLAYQPLRLANNFDFREDDLFVPVFLAVLLCVESAQWVGFWFFVAVSWTVKESAPIYTCLMGLWLFADGVKDRRASGRAGRSRWLGQGLLLVVFSLAAFAIINVKITPHFVGSGPEAKTMMSKRLARFGSTNTEIMTSMLLHPIAFAGEALRPMLELKTVKYLLDVTTPFLAFVLAAPFTALVVLAGLALNLLVNQPTIGFHYECVLIPFLFYILARGIASLEARGRLVGAGAPALIALSFLLFYGRSPVESIRHHAPSEHELFVASELAKIDPGASVATQTALFPHIDHRREAYLYAPPAAGAVSGLAPNGTPYDVIALDLSPEIDRYGSVSLETQAASVDPARYGLVVDRDGLKIWHRR